MLYGLNHNGVKIKATPKSKSVCPFCSCEMISKCGSINSWHWAHANNCPFETEPETEWHLNWKSVFPKENTEVMMSRNGIVKIADAVNGRGQVFEFQHSQISVEEIRVRESFYEDMYWVFDVRNAANRFLTKGIPNTYERVYYQKNDNCTFKDFIETEKREKK